MWDQAQIDAIQAFYLEYNQERYEHVYEQPNYETNKRVVNVADKLLLTADGSTEMVQPYQEAFTEKGTVSSPARKLDVEMYKIDMKVAPRQYAKNNYLAHLRQLRTNDPAYFVPYEQWVIDSMFKQMDHDIAMNLMWTGEKAAVVAGTAGASADVADGFLKIIADEVTATNITPITTAAMTNANAVTVIEAFVDGVLATPGMANRQFYLHVSQATKLKYQRSYRANFGANTHANEFGIVRVEGYENVQLVAEAGMTDEGIVMASMGNLYVGMDGPPSLKIEEHLRSLYFMLDGSIGFQFADTAELFVNQHATV
jgi:hypothetical protein